MALSHFAIGISIVALAWAFFLVVGSSFLIACSDDAASFKGSHEPYDLLIATATGVACTIFIIFMLAALKLLFIAAMLPTFAIILLVSIALAVRRVGFAVVRQIVLRSIRSAAGPGSLGILAICILLAVPALLPPSLFDDTMYHLPYALDWAKAGGLVVDRYLRFPLSQFNIELLYAAVFALHEDSYVQFVTWFFFALAATGLVSVTASLLKELGADEKFAEVAGFLTACVFVSCPLVLRYDDVAYVDIPAGALLLAYAAAAFRARRNFRPYGIAMAVTGGSFIGVKLSLAPLSLAFILLLVFIGLQARVSTKRILATAALLAVFASPWFIRNAIVSGDPIDPILNLSIRHVDPYWNEVDLNAQRRDLFRPIPLIAAPILMFRYPSFAADSVSLSFAFLYVPFVALVSLALRKSARNAMPNYALAVAIVVSATITELLITNYSARYFLHFFPLFLVVLTLTAWLCAKALAKRWSPTSTWLTSALTAAAILIFAIPSPGAETYYHLVRAAFDDADLAVRFPQAYLTRVEGYTAADELAKLVAASGTGENVLAMQYVNLAYYFRVRGVTSVGDWFGPGRLADLGSAIDEDRLGQYMTRRDIGAVMISRDAQPFGPAIGTKMFAELAKLDYTDITDPESDIREFVRPSVLALAAKNGAVSGAIEASTSVDFLQRYSAGEIDPGPRPNGQPDDHTVLVLPVLVDGATLNSITVISGNKLSFSGIKADRGSALSFDVAKASWQGTPAIARVDITVDGKVRHLFTKLVTPAIGDEPQWTHVSLPINSMGENISITFTAGSIPNGGIADWISYVHPKLSHATMERRSNLLRSANTATGSPQETAVAESLSGGGMHSRAGDGDGLRLHTTGRLGRFEFISDPAVVPTETSGQLPAVTVKWNVPGASRIEIHMKDVDGQLFAEGGGSGFAATGNWVSAGAKFFLQDVSDGSPGRTVATLVASPCRRCL